MHSTALLLAWGVLQQQAFLLSLTLELLGQQGNALCPLPLSVGTASLLWHSPDMSVSMVRANIHYGIGL